MKERWHKKIDETQKERAAVLGRLNNPGFVAKAGDEVVAEHKARVEMFTEKEKALRAAIEAVTGT